MNSGSILGIFIGSDDVEVASWRQGMSLVGNYCSLETGGEGWKWWFGGWGVG